MRRMDAKLSVISAQTFFTLACWGMLGCAGGPQSVGDGATYGRENGRVWVSGPWETIKPSIDVDEVIDQLCPAILNLPFARDEDYGREYCGIIYSMDEGTYYASHPSSLSDTRAGRVSPKKNCLVPRIVRDARGESAPLADYHSHPWSPSPITKSTADLLSRTQLYSIRIQFDSGCKLQKLIPYVTEDRPGELYERRGKSWKLIGLIKPEHKATGFITLVND
jgi:hypothetical protein